MSSSQSEEWTTVFTRKKNYKSNQNRERCFFHMWEKWYVQSEATEVLVCYTAVFSVVTKRSSPLEGGALRDDTKNGCVADYRGVWVSRQNSRLFLQLAERRFAHIRGEKFFSKSFFSLKKWKTFQKWSGIVSFVSLSIKKTVESRQNNSGRGKTEKDVSLCCAFVGATLFSIYKLKLILKPAILLKFTHFQLYIQNKQLRLLVVLGLPHILTVIYVFKKRFY